MAVYSSGAACSRGSLRTLAHTATHSWQMYARGKALGFENSLSSGPSGLRQNEQHRTSDSPSPVRFMVQSPSTDYSARRRSIAKGAYSRVRPLTGSRSSNLTTIV